MENKDVTAAISAVGNTIVGTGHIDPCRGQTCKQCPKPPTCPPGFMLPRRPAGVCCHCPRTCVPTKKVDVVVNVPPKITKTRIGVYSLAGIAILAVLATLFLR